MKYMAVSVTLSSKPNSTVNSAYIYYSDDELQLELNNHVSAEAGMAALRQLEKRLGRPAEMTINRYDRNIFYKELHGILEDGD